MTASLSTDLPLAQPTAHNASMSFSGRGGDFLRLLITGSLFQIPTFGFYRFWLITKLRRHLWANTQIDGEAFEYTGTAKELLIGFLIALAVLVPLYIAYFIIGIMAEEQYAFASVPLVIVMYVLAHFGSYRARKYRASRTIFRGVRFWMKGSGWAYAVRAILWDLATLLTLGLALPWAMASLERYRMRHTYFGSIQGDFVGTGWSLFKRGWWVWASGLVLLTFTFFLFVASDIATGSGKPALQGLAGLVGLLIVALVPLAMAIFTRWHIDGLRFSDVTAASNFRAGTYYGLIFKLLFSSFGFLIAFGIIAGVAAYLFSSFFTAAMAEADGLSLSSLSAGLLVVVAYLIVLLGLGVLQRYFLGRGLWAAIVTSTTVTNLRAIDAAVAAGQPAGVLGEGLADALDFNVGI
ncbi:DUF898 family protein [Microvirga sp. CF3062]|uniref:YjgN family protein n=1 Tax=Microvirga sp. CF3062 TaxID=3110182 RepID=UPI002E7A7FBB|nr:DUF898 family protein [Microvirga sp. CF3062]MEE1654729.1 DUF898 family protein [Microvirga sp. CF3062]